MEIQTKTLWEQTPGMCEEIPTITSYIPNQKSSDMAVVILPGGGYGNRAPHEGDGYARFFAEQGICAFVVGYRVSPHRFPLPLLDARRAVRTVRFCAAQYGIDKHKIAIMGSSAGGHLAALTSTYYEPVAFENIDETDREPFVPDAQILCYPVIKLLGKKVAHLGSGKNLLADRQAEMGEELSPDQITSAKTPPAFVWHTADDQAVPVVNSLDYVRSLHHAGVAAELHIFPDGRHGLGLADEDDPVSKHVSQWSGLLLNWLKYIGFKD